MKKIKEGSENNPRFKMMENADALLDIEKTYGKEVKDALVKYCALKKLRPEDVIDDTQEDGIGQTKWDKFDKWAQKKLGLDIMGGFDDDWDYTGSEERAKREKGLSEVPMGDMDSFMEGSGSHMDEQDILDFIGEELRGCEWV